MKECRDIVKELVAMLECGAFEIEPTENEIGLMDYKAFCYDLACENELSFDGLYFRINGEKLDVQLTSKEDKALNKAFTKLIDSYIVFEGETTGLDEIQAFLQE